MRLILVRHPRPQVRAGVCYGASDVAVAPDEHARVAQALTHTLPRHTPLVSSPLQRCATLARTLYAALESPSLRFDPRLAELDFGQWEMRAWDAILRTEIDAWAADVALYRPGGGESVSAAAQRVADAYADLRQRQWPCAIVVCHAGTMRLMAACHAGLLPADMARHAARAPHAIDYGACLILGD
jgi:alpha-ribazole phosphatase